MQLDRLLDFHKALADVNRLRIVLLLTTDEMSGQRIAEKTGLTPATVTHHMNALRKAGLIRERREKNTIFFALHEKTLQEKSMALVRKVEQMTSAHAEYEKVIKNFFDREGRLKSIPAQRKKKMFVFEHMLKGLEVGREYTEKELDEYIKQFHDDHCTIRREFIINHYMYREDGIYTMNPPELWATIE